MDYTCYLCNEGYHDADAGLHVQQWWVCDSCLDWNYDVLHQDEAIFEEIKERIEKRLQDKMMEELEKAFGEEL